MKVYGIAEIAAALGEDPRLVAKWGERFKLPPPDAQLSVGPVWLQETIEPMIENGRPRMKSTRPYSYEVRSLMTISRYQTGTPEQLESRFLDSILDVRRYVTPRVEWNHADRTAFVTIGCAGMDETTAADAAKQIIMRRARVGADIGVEDVDIVVIKQLPGDAWGSTV